MAFDDIKKRMGNVENFDKHASKDVNIVITN